MLCFNLLSGSLTALLHKAAVDAVLNHQFIVDTLLDDLSAIHCSTSASVCILGNWLGVQLKILLENYRA